MPNRTQNVMQMMTQDRSVGVSLEVADYVSKGRVQFKSGAAEEFALPITGEKFRAGESVWVMRDAKSGRKYLLGTDRAL
jgi:hypothetical protein